MVHGGCDVATAVLVAATGGGASGGDDTCDVAAINQDGVLGLDGEGGPDNAPINQSGSGASSIGAATGAGDGAPAI